MMYIVYKVPYGCTHGVNIGGTRWSSDPYVVVTEGMIKL